MKALRNYLTTTIFLLGFLSIYIIINYEISYPMNIDPQFSQRIRPRFTAVLNEEQPELFFLGDSMLAAALDESVVSEQLSKRVYQASLAGTASAIWYLIIKNNIIAADHHPEHMVIFFRDSMMTLPDYRVTGSYFDMVDELASPDDTLLIERAYINQMSHFERAMEAYFPFYGGRWNIRESIDHHIRYTLGNHILDCDQTCMDYSLEIVFIKDILDDTFLSEAIDSADEILYTKNVLDFEEQVGKSFLPEIIRLCQENDIQLVMVRLPILRFVNQETRPSELDDYIQKLSIYLEENDVTFLDFDQKEIPADYFADPLHLNEKGKVLFTQELVEALKPIIK